MISINPDSARFGFGVFAAALCLGFTAPVFAQDSSNGKGMFPPMASAQEYELGPQDSTHPALRLTPDKTEMVRLDEDAHSVIIGNPAHMNVLMDNPRLLLIAPRAPGATHFTVLNRSGRVIMQRHVIVTGPKEDYIRIRRSCINGGNGCQPTSVYYCPDVCHDVSLMGGGQPNNPDQAVMAAPQNAPAPAIINDNESAAEDEGSPDVNETENEETGDADGHTHEPSGHPQESPDE